MDKLTDNAYGEMVKKATPPSKSIKNIPLAFLFGGAICCFGHALLQLYKYIGLADDVAGTAVSVTLIFLASLLTGLNVYDKVAVHAGAGMMVPITGFANATTSPAMDFKSEGYVLGLAAKMFTISGPVIVYGLSAGIVYGLIIFLFRLY